MTQALALPRSAMEVDTQQAADFAGQLMKHAAAGGPMFPKDLSQSQATIMARIAIAYGLDPIAGELTVYQGRMYLTIEGRVRVANSHPAFDGMECVPASDDERKAFRCGEDEHLWVCRVWRKDRRFPFVGYGRSAGKSDRNPVSRDYAQEMAQKRAKHRALRDAFSLPLPGREEDNDDTPMNQTRRYEATDAQIIEGVVIDQEAPEPITPEQIRGIHTIVGKLAWSEDEYRDVLRHTYQVDTSKDLTEGQAAAVLEMLHVLHEQGTAEPFLARIPKGLDALRMTGLDDELVRGEPSKAHAPTVIPEHGYEQESASEPASEGPLFEAADERLEELAEAEERKPWTKRQQEALLKLLPPEGLAAINWETLTEDEAAGLIVMAQA